MRNFFYRLFAGRYGIDGLSRVLLIAALVLLVVDVFIRGVAKVIVWLLVLALLLYCYFRMFSRNISARARENARYEKFKQKLKFAFASRRDRFRQRKEYRFFRCPSCKVLLRVPRGRGKLVVTCRKCGARFERRT